MSLAVVKSTTPNFANTLITHFFTQLLSKRKNLLAKKMPVLSQVIIYKFLL